MPDAYGNLKGISVPAAAWERIFGRTPDAFDMLENAGRYSEPSESARENQNRDSRPPSA